MSQQQRTKVESMPLDQFMLDYLLREDKSMPTNKPLAMHFH